MPPPRKSTIPGNSAKKVTTKKTVKNWNSAKSTAAVKKTTKKKKKIVNIKARDSKKTNTVRTLPKPEPKQITTSYRANDMDQAAISDASNVERFNVMQDKYNANPNQDVMSKGYNEYDLITNADANTDNAWTKNPTNNVLTPAAQPAAPMGVGGGGKGGGQGGSFDTSGITPQNQQVFTPYDHSGMMSAFTQGQQFVGGQPYGAQPQQRPMNNIQGAQPTGGK